MSRENKSGKEKETMRRNTVVIFACLLLSCAVGAAVAAELQGDQARNDLSKLQGSWVLVAGEWDGKKIADEHLGGSKITFETDKIIVIAPHQFAEPIIADLVKIDATKDPKEMHFIRRNGPSAGKTIVAIFKFDGDDVYHFAFDPTGATTPKELAAKDGSGHIKHTWKRVKQ
jgi:uncharacterized protein (TIGR03067 family)